MASESDGPPEKREQRATEDAGISPEDMESGGDKPASSIDEGVEDDADPGDEPEKQSPLAGMRVRDVRKLLDKPDNPLYPEAVKSAQRAIQPFLDSQANWAKLINSDALEALKKSTNLVTSKAVQDILKSAQPSIDPSIWTAVAPDTSKLLASIRPSAELGEQFAKIASQLTVVQPPAVRWTPPKHSTTGGTLYASAVEDDEHLDTEEPENLDPLDAADDLTLAEVEDEAERQAEQDDRHYAVLLAIAGALSDLNAKADADAKRQADAEEAAQSRRDDADAQDKKDRKRDGRRYWVPALISLVSLILVAITLWATLHPPAEPSDIRPAPSQEEVPSSPTPSPTSVPTPTPST